LIGSEAAMAGAASGEATMPATRVRRVSLIFSS
jgi:hypothetical protein